MPVLEKNSQIFLIGSILRGMTLAFASLSQYTLEFSNSCQYLSISVANQPWEYFEQF